MQPHREAALSILYRLIWVFWGHYTRGKKKQHIFLGGGAFPLACGSSQVRDGTCTTAVTQAAAVTKPDP